MESDIVNNDSYEGNELTEPKRALEEDLNNDDGVRGDMPAHENIPSSPSSSTASPQPPRHGVEWIYPSDYTGTRHELGSDETVSRIDASSEASSSAYVVDPNDVEYTPYVDGILLQSRRCYLKVFGFVVCDDTFPVLVNPMFFSFFLGLLFIASISAGTILSENNKSGKDVSNNGSVYPSEQINETYVEINQRIPDITQSVLELSGNVTLEENSPQNRALNWILHDDELKLAHNSSNLLQRYSIMVFYFSLSGKNWEDKNGYGSGNHECEWYGIKCSTKEGITRIKSLEMENNNLNGRIPEEIKVFSALTELELDINLISGNIPISIGHLKKLKKLYLSHNALTGTIPAEIIDCESLKELYINSNNIIGTIPTFSDKKNSLTILHLQENELSGAIPMKIGSLRFLESLILRSNNLTGTIPLEIGNMSSLTVLDVAGNNLTGKIPSSLANSSALTRVDLSHNLLSGLVPTNLYRHPKIFELFLDDNKLTGTIPTQFKVLPKARRIYLYDNMINGTVPESLGDIPTLNKLRLHHTMLSGTIPQNLCDRQLMYLTVDCAGEKPEVFCSCCTKCF